VGATLMPGCKLGRGAFVAAGTRASGVVVDGAVLSGSPAKVAFHVSRLMDLETGLQHPWMHHFRDAYPERTHPRLATLLAQIESSKGHAAFRRPSA